MLTSVCRAFHLQNLETPAVSFSGRITHADNAITNAIEINESPRWVLPDFVQDVVLKPIASLQICRSKSNPKSTPFWVSPRFEFICDFRPHIPEPLPKRMQWQRGSDGQLDWNFSQGSLSSSGTLLPL